MDGVNESVSRAETASLVSKGSTWACLSVRTLHSALLAVKVAGLVVCNEYIEKERIRKTRKEKDSALVCAGYI